MEIEQKEKEQQEEQKEEHTTKLFVIRTTANREDQVLEFLTSNAKKKKIPIYSALRPHGMRGYIFVETDSEGSARDAAAGVPYARGVLGGEVPFSEIEPLIETEKKEVNIIKNDIAEVISGPFKREKVKVIRIDKEKGDVVVEMLEAAVPIPITLKIDAIKVIRREGEE